MSWLQNALKQNSQECLESETFEIGSTQFDLVYSPSHTALDNKQSQVGSLALRHLEEEGVIFRYRMFIKRAGGDFVQWGAEANECHPAWKDSYKAFGPDVQKKPESGAPLERPLGIFGLRHEDLTKSEWVENDTMTVKVEVETMEDSAVDTVDTSEVGSDVTVPPATLATNLLSMLEASRCTDITFIIEEKRIAAHSFILAARSEVFDRELNGSMREAVSKVIEIRDADFTTFDVFLRFLYTDDLDHTKAMVSKLTELAKSPVVAGSSHKEAEVVTHPRTAILQNLLAVTHRYQVQRLRLWCERQLCQYICKDRVCSILCQAHLYEASQLQKACLKFIKNNMEAVMATRGFGSLSAEWPEVTLKINTFCAGLSEQGAAEAKSALEESRKKRSSEDVAAVGAKRARAE